jgi:ParB family transcriptional regulator, chromosome partitioning protein
MQCAAFLGVRKYSCTDPQCYRAKLDARITRTLQKKPGLVQISSGCGSREGAPIGRNRHVELDLKRARLGQAAKANPTQRTCEKTADAIVMDGGKRGQIVKSRAILYFQVLNQEWTAA